MFINLLFWCIIGQQQSNRSVSEGEFKQASNSKKTVTEPLPALIDKIIEIIVRVPKDFEPAITSKHDKIKVVYSDNWSCTSSFMKHSAWYLDI